MNLPFTTDQFLEVFRLYNLTIWPAQIIAYLLGIGALVLVFWRRKFSDRIITEILGFFWLWIGIVYHIMFFSAINPAARIFGALFIIQGLLFAWHGVVKDNLRFRFEGGIYAWTGAVFLLYALVVYPVIGALAGHGWPYSPMFGVTPCPGTIFTFGLLLWTSERFSKWLLLIPFIWSLIGSSAAISFGIWEDLGLLVSSLVGVALLFYRDRTATKGITAETSA
ncbi:MAG TPA: DUF6064 family protein [bacterium]|nr:DUF6064 family protein [bacterium]